MLAVYLTVNTEEIFKSLKTNNYLQDLDSDAFIERLAHYYGELIVLHPFREGNGRAIRTFLALLAKSLGWHIAWDKMDPQANILASISSYGGDAVPMQKMLHAIIEPL